MVTRLLVTCAAAAGMGLRVDMNACFLVTTVFIINKTDMKIIDAVVLAFSLKHRHQQPLRNCSRTFA